MATHDYVVDNQTAPNFRADLNSALAAIVSQNSNATAPTTTYANMLWYDTANNLLRKRNETNSGWITLGTVDEVNSTFLPNSLANQTQAETGTDNATLMTPLRTKQAIDILGGSVLLGTMITTSGSSVTLSGLTLTNYKFILATFNNVSHNNPTNANITFGGFSMLVTGAAAFLSGAVLIDLNSGVGFVGISSAIGGVSGFTTTTSSTSISVSVSAGSFDSGSVRVYGIR